MTRDVESQFAFPSLPLDEAKRLAALRLEHERLIAAQEDFLEDAARRWRRVGRLRAYLAAVSERYAGDALTAEVWCWLAWASAHCDALDPLSAQAMEELQAYAAALQSPPDLPPFHPEEQLWRDMGWLDEFLDDEDGA